ELNRRFLELTRVTFSSFPHDLLSFGYHELNFVSTQTGEVQTNEFCIIWGKKPPKRLSHAFYFIYYVYLFTKLISVTRPRRPLAQPRETAYNPKYPLCPSLFCGGPEKHKSVRRTYASV
ncbi:MAG: hypothetical protein FWC64_10730, partial [Treponema sp.]|nr:hypothetical protein [Treponema sp.]